MDRSLSIQGFGPCVSTIDKRGGEGGGKQGGDDYREGGGVLCTVGWVHVPANKLITTNFHIRPT